MFLIYFFLYLVPYGIIIFFKNFLFPCHPQDLKTSKVDNLQKQAARNSVEHLLATVHQLACHPSTLMDNHSLLAALEQLTDVARQTGYVEKKKYYAIFCQCKSLVRDGNLASVVVHLPPKTRRFLSLGQPSQSLPTGPCATLMHPRHMDTLACCWILQEAEGCLVEGLIPSTTAVSNKAIWGYFGAIAQDVFLSYCVINFLAP